MVNVYQVYFDEATKKNCEPEWRHYDNSERLNEFFENQVIARLIRLGQHRRQEYFAVFSHDVKESIPFKEEGLRFSPQSLETIVKKNDIDVFSFCKRRRNTNIVTQAEHYHKGFLDIINKVLKFCGMELPHKLDKIILFNLMVCRGDFWQAYYNDLLEPTMRILRDIPEAYNDSGYALIGRPMTPEKANRFEKAFGKPYYPFHPFICERLASIYLQLNPQWTFKQIF